MDLFNRTDEGVLFKSDVDTLCNRLRILVSRRTAYTTVPLTPNETAIQQIVSYLDGWVEVMLRGITENRGYELRRQARHIARLDTPSPEE